jgi:hypothetical protein
MSDGKETRTEDPIVHKSIKLFRYNEKKVVLLARNKTEDPTLGSVAKKRCICTFCNKILGTAFSLHRHLRNVHKFLVLKVPTPFQCHFCNRWYSQKRNLISHLRSRHPSSIGEHLKLRKLHRKINCPECPSPTFQNRKALRKHITSVHGITFESEELSFNCREGM